jgi:hypothetical protein
VQLYGRRFVPTSRRLHRVPDYDVRALQIEIELLADWYWAWLLGTPVPDAARKEFISLWQPVLQRLACEPSTLVLRDYHSPNLMWMPDSGSGEAASSVGLIDFQDAVNGHPAYDLVSLLQDARLDVPEDVERRLYAHYVALMTAREPGFDAHDFGFAYAALGAQRNTKILGIFARLARRDHKPQYLRHMPRIWRYLARDLAHPQLGALRAWYDANFPPELRERVLDA